MILIKVLVIESRFTVCLFHASLHHILIHSIKWNDFCFFFSLFSIENTCTSQMVHVMNKQFGV